MASQELILGGPWYFSDYIQPAAAEFVGCWIFVFIGTMSASSSQDNLVGIALAHGFTIFLLVTGFGEISGGHFNPAVSLATFIAGHMSWRRLVLHVVAQLCGGIIGSACTLAVLGLEKFDLLFGGNTIIRLDVSHGQALFFEWLATMVLCMSVLHTACDARTSSGLGPLAIGLTVAAGILAGGPITGASMNPARSFGPVLIYTAIWVTSYSLGDLWHFHWVHWVGPGLGAIFAGLLYRLCFGSEDKRFIFKPRQRGGTEAGEEEVTLSMVPQAGSAEASTRPKTPQSEFITPAQSRPATAKTEETSPKSRPTTPKAVGNEPTSELTVPQHTTPKAVGNEPTSEPTVPQHSGNEAPDTNKT